MARLSYCDYHNMIAILEKYEHNVDFHPIVDFVEASYIMRNLKLKDEAGISSLPNAELFENLTLMGYNILPNQKFTFQKGQFSHQWKYLIHTIMQCLSPKSTGFNEFNSNIATAVAPQSPQHDLSSLIHPPVTTATIPTVIPTKPPIRQYTRRARIAQSLALLTVADEPASPLEDDSQGEACLTDKDGGVAQTYGEDATIKGRNLETKEEAAVEKSTERGKVPTVSVPICSGMVPIASVVTPYSRRKEKEKMVESDTPKKKRLQDQIDVQMAREMEEQNNETIAKYLQEYEQFAADLSIRERIELINDLVKYQDNYAKVLKYESQQRKPLSKKQQREIYMSVLKSHSGWKAKHFKGMSLEEIREKFIPVWKQIEDFVPMGSKEEGERFKKGLRLEQDSAKKVKTSEEVSEEDLKTMMQLVPVEEVYVEALQSKHLIIDWEIYTEGQRTYRKIIRLRGNTVVYQFFIDMLKHLDREDLNQLWNLVRETLNIGQATSDKEKELWVELKRLYEPDVEDKLWTQTQTLMHDPVEWRLYDSCGVHHVLSRDQAIFMLVEKDYPLRKGLVIVMISNKLQVENYSQMANDLIQKIYKIANSSR
nr:hypothetical protein [Tanacetum cinerariifolium]